MWGYYLPRGFCYTPHRRQAEARVASELASESGAEWESGPGAGGVERAHLPLSGVDVFAKTPINYIYARPSVSSEGWKLSRHGERWLGHLGEEADESLDVLRIVDEMPLRRVVGFPPFRPGNWYPSGRS